MVNWQIFNFARKNPIDVLRCEYEYLSFYFLRYSANTGTINF